MFRKASFFLLTAGLLTACSSNDPNEDKVSSHLKIDAQASELECRGSVSFTPEPGIAFGTYEDMNKIADHLCGSPAEIGKKHSYVGSYPDSKKPKLERVTLEFSCPENTLPQTDRILNVTEKCAEMFENFAAKQR
jgi:hypothetical protein